MVYSNNQDNNSSYRLNSSDPNGQVCSSNSAFTVPPQMENDVIMCSICHDNINSSGNNTITLPCHHTHTFHLSCMREVVAHATHTSCPLCRKPYDRSLVDGVSRVSNPTSQPSLESTEPSRPSQRSGIRRNRRPGIRMSIRRIDGREYVSVRYRINNGSRSRNDDAFDDEYGDAYTYEVEYVERVWISLSLTLTHSLSITFFYHLTFFHYTPLYNC